MSEFIGVKRDGATLLEREPEVVAAVLQRQRKARAEFDQDELERRADFEADQGRRREAAEEADEEFVETEFDEREFRSGEITFYRLSVVDGVPQVESTPVELKITPVKKTVEETELV